MRRNINFNSHDQSAAALRLSGFCRASDALAASGSSRTIRRHLSVLLTASWRAPRFHSNLDLVPDLDHLVARQLEIVADPLRVAADRGERRLLPARRFSRRNGHLQHAILLMAEQLISLLDLIELEPMRNERS